MSFWSSQTLESRLPNLVEPFSNKQIDSASYELCLGEEVYISPFPDTPEGDRRKVLLKKGETVSIPPGQFAFLITSETVSVPKDAIAFISMKFKPKAKGLINVSGFHVDPGYKGRLIFAVYNAGPLSFQMKYGERLFSLWIADLDKTDDRPRKKVGYDSIPTSLTNSPEAVSSLPSLVKRLDEMDKRLESYSIKQAIIWAIGIALVLSFLKPLTDQLATSWLGLNNNRSELVKPNPASRPASESK